MASLRAQLLFLVLLWHSLFLTLTAVDPCKSYTSLNNPYRSTAYNLTNQDVALCDDKLVRGWYRFTNRFIGGLLPTTKPEPRTCGTVAPIWMRGRLPTAVGQIVHTWACINLRNKYNGCMWNIRISVKKCSKESEPDFYVYFLRPPPGCAMAYCAGHKKPCPKGQAGTPPNCTDIIDFPYYLVPTPNVTYLAENEPRVTMQCTFEFPQWTNVSFEVEWFVNGESRKSEEICVDYGENCTDRKSLLKHGEFIASNRLHCRLRMKYSNNSANNWTPWKQSNSSYVGIEVSPTHVHVKECATTVIVKFQPTVPFIPHGNEDHVVINVYIPFSKKDNNTAVDTCKLILNSTGVVPNELTIKGVCDEPDESQQSVDYHFGIFNSHPFWGTYRLKSVQVTVENTQNGLCSSAGEPNYITFDKKEFRFNEPGDYVLYSNRKRGFEVHTRLWHCNPNHPTRNITCNCGIAVREGRDVIVITVCNRIYPYTKFEFPNQLRYYISSPWELRRGTHVYTYNTKSKTIGLKISFPSGVLIEVERTYWGLDVLLHAPNLDKNNTGGLCGNFNGDADDDFHNGGDGKSYTDPINFGLSWKVAENKSYFEVLPPDVSKNDTSQSCFCHSTIGEINEDEDCGYTPTHFYRHNLQPKFEITARKYHIAPDNVKKSDRKKRDIDHEGNTYSDDIIDLEDWNFFVDENDLARIHRKHRIRRDIARQENATQYCKSIIEDSVAGKICGNLPGMDLNNVMRQCIMDLQVTGDTSFADSAFSLMAAQCETEAFKNLSLFTRDSDGNLHPPAEIVDNLCPSDCSNHGNCNNGTCICDEGYTAADCGASTNSIPELFGIYGSGLCDIRNRPCEKTNIFGQGFIESENLTCHAAEFKVYPGNWLPNATAHRLRGEVIDLFGVKCNLPHPPTKLGDYDNQGTPAGGLQISISNDGERKSDRQVRFMSYDSVCLTCNKTAGTCALRNDSCIIKGHCFGQVQANPRDWCQLCMPGVNQSSWTRRRDNSPPKFTTPSMCYALNGEDLHLQIEARDPDNRPLTYSLGETDATGYSFASNGLLRYNVTSDEVKRFKFTATDECSATDNITITIKILRCPCQNEGKCHPHPFQPRGSGKYYCTCPTGYTGSTCENNIDDCHRSSCVNGTCIDGINNYTCRCSVGFTGLLCNEKVLKCTNQSCYPGVQCIEAVASGSVTCAPCPLGLSGDGKTCLATLSTSTKIPDTKTTEPGRTSTKEPDGTTPQTPTPTEALGGDAKSNKKEPVSKLMMILIIVAVVVIAIIIGAAFILCRRKYLYNVSNKKGEDPDDMELEPPHASLQVDYKQECDVKSADDEPGHAQNTYQSLPKKDQKEFDNFAFEN